MSDYKGAKICVASGRDMTAALTLASILAMTEGNTVQEFERVHRSNKPVKMRYKRHQGAKELAKRAREENSK